MENVSWEFLKRAKNQFHFSLLFLCYTFFFASAWSCHRMWHSQCASAHACGRGTFHPTTRLCETNTKKGTKTTESTEKTCWCPRAMNRNKYQIKAYNAASEKSHPARHYKSQLAPECTVSRGRVSNRYIPSVTRCYLSPVARWFRFPFGFRFWFRTSRLAAGCLTNKPVTFGSRAASLAGLLYMRRKRYDLVAQLIMFLQGFEELFAKLAIKNLLK